jgi:hypothetical protein
MPDAIAITAYFNFTEANHNAWLSNLPSPANIIKAVNDRWDYKETVEEWGAEILKVGYAESIKRGAAFIKKYAPGTRLVVYEGGQHMQPWQQGIWSYNDILYDAQISPRMYDVYMKNFQLFADEGCDLFMHFSHIGYRKMQWGSWGALETASDIYSSDLKKAAPKYMAVIDANISRK